MYKEIYRKTIAMTSLMLSEFSTYEIIIMLFFYYKE